MVEAFVYSRSPPPPPPSPSPRAIELRWRGSGCICLARGVHVEFGIIRVCFGLSIYSMHLRGVCWSTHRRRAKRAKRAEQREAMRYVAMRCDAMRCERGRSGGEWIGIAIVRYSVACAGMPDGMSGRLCEEVRGGIYDVRRYH